MPEGSDFVVEALTVRTGDALLVDDLSLSIGCGDILGITGPSGSGKSTLIHVLAGLAAPDAGRLLLDGRPVTLWSDAAVGLILQHHHLPGILTAHEAVSLPLQARGIERQQVAERSDRILAALGMTDHAHQLISELSGGERQRVAVARALAGEPRLILGDEPTAALDQASCARVIDHLIEAARAGAIVIIASSDPELIGNCTGVVTLSGCRSA